ncbi:MAG: hypothetical protein K0Q72_3328 [Armatimonadetes bacterium]|nr:hypothetical protein [Armatimonadota bacterium]
MPVVDAVTIHPKSGDFASWLHYGCWGVPGGTRRFWGHLLGSTAVLVALAHLLLGRGSPWAATGVGIVVALAVFPWWRWFGFGVTAGRACREHPEYLRLQHCQAAAEGLVMVDRGDRVAIPWSRFSALIAADRHLFFSMNRRVIILPRRDFATPTASQQFFNLCEAYWQPTVGAPRQPEAAVRIIPGEYQTRLAFEVRAEDLSALREAVVRARARTIVRQLNRHPDTAAWLGLCLIVPPAAAWHSAGPAAFVAAVTAVSLVIGVGTWWWSRAMAQNCPQLPGEQEITLSPKGMILTRTDGRTFFFGWSVLNQILRTSQCVVFQSERGTSVGIPERVFKDATELQRFVTCAQEWHANKPEW